MRTLHSAALSGLVALALTGLAAPTSAQQTNAPGWQSTLRANPGGGYAELANGDLVSFDGQFVELLNPDGSSKLQLADLGGPFFGGILLADPTETFAVVGESSNGDVFRVPLDGSGASLIGNVFFNYDAEFAPDGSLYISAATGGFGAGNDIVRLDVDTGLQTIVASVSGPSGPLTFDGMGNMYYATQSTAFPAPPDATDVIFWSDAQINGGTLLGELDALTFGAGFAGASTMICDRATGAVYMGETNFGTGLGRIIAVGSSPGTSVELALAPTGAFVTLQGVTSAGGPELLIAFQPEGSGRIRYNSSDFGANNDQFDLQPLRPSLAFTGPGTTGTGNVDVAATGFVPGGSVFLAFGATSLTGPEVPVTIGGIPLFLALDQGSVDFLPAPFPTDGAGAFGFSFFHPGGFNGLVTFQGLGLDAGASVIGTSNAVPF